MKTNMNLFTKKDYKTLHNTLREDKDLTELLLEMQTEQGISGNEARENIEAMMHAVAQRENLCNMLSEDANAVLDEFLHDSQRMTGADRKILLHKLWFGLKLYQDDALMEQMKNGATAEKLFLDYYAKNGNNPAITEQLLEADIRKLLANNHVSPKVMGMIAKNLEKKEDMLAASAVLGENGMRIKCVAAMDLYLRNQKDLTVEEAVNAACTDAELEAMADAVAFGQITEERALKILRVIVGAAIILGIALVVSRLALISLTADAVESAFFIEENFAAVEAAKQGAITANGMTTFKLKSLAKTLLMGGGAGAVLTEAAAKLIGRLAGTARYVRNIQKSKAVETLNTMEAHAEDKQKASAAENVEAKQHTAVNAVKEEKQAKAFA